MLSARSVLGALDRGKYTVYQVGITHEGSWLSGEDVLGGFERRDHKSLRPVTIFSESGQTGLYARGNSGALEQITPLDLAFPVLHGSFGEDGAIQGLFEMIGLPYVGAGVLASAVAMDKAVFKEVMRSRGIPVLEWLVLNTTEMEPDLDRALERAESVAGYPLFIKPANLGSSVGISKVRSRSDLIEGLMDAAQYDRRVLVERGIEAREIEVSVLGNEEPEASLPGEIIPSDEFYSYRAKYLDHRSKLHIPAPIDEQTTEQARRIAIEAYQAIDGAGMARVDMLLDKATGRLYMNEINTIPGFTRISMYPKLWEAWGISYPELMDRLIELAQSRHAQKQKLVRSYEGAA